MQKSSWTSRLAQSRVTLVLCLLVAFTLLHSLVVAGLRSAVDHKLSFWTSGPRQLSDFQRNSKDPLNNAAPFYRAAWELCNRSPQTGPIERLFQAGEMVAAVSADPAAAQAAIAPFQPALELLAQGHTRTHADYGFPYRSGMSAQLPNFLSIRTLARIAAIDGALARSRQDWAALSSRTAQALRFIRTMEPDHTLITAMIKVACADIVLKPIEGVEHARYTPELRAEMELLQASLDSLWRRALDGERLSGVKLYQLMESESESLSSLGQVDSNPGTGVAQFVYRIGGKPLLLIDELVYLDALQKQERDINVKPRTFPFVVASTLTFNAGRAHANLEKLRARLQTLTH
jgi:hypothetical protein